jgi:hypothetical protein
MIRRRRQADGCDGCGELVQVLLARHASPNAPLRTPLLLAANRATLRGATLTAASGDIVHALVDHGGSNRMMRTGMSRRLRDGPPAEIGEGHVEAVTVCLMPADVNATNDRECRCTGGFAERRPGRCPRSAPCGRGAKSMPGTTGRILDVALGWRRSGAPVVGQGGRGRGGGSRDSTAALLRELDGPGARMRTPR